jgi:hypothetical protein
MLNELGILAYSPEVRMHSSTRISHHHRASRSFIVAHTSRARARGGGGVVVGGCVLVWKRVA